MSKNLVLTGMMGVGKTTVGKSLAEKLSYNFIDIDRLIETREGSSINMIFKRKSEAYFRRLETLISLEELKKDNIVVSLGGGAFLDKSIRRAVRDSSISIKLKESFEATRLPIVDLPTPIIPVKTRLFLN